MTITHAAQTESVTFLLDETGICFAAVATPSAPPESFATARESAERCIGAQYVASVDITAPGGLVAMPREGTPLVFAAIDGEGRVALVRTGPLLRFVTSTTVAHRKGEHDEPASTMRGPVADEPSRSTMTEAEVVTLRPMLVASLVPSLVPATLAWGTPRPVDTDVDLDVARDSLDLIDSVEVESVPFSLRRRVSDVVPRGTADDEAAPVTERARGLAS
jgi:hypothetical protein